MKFSSKLRGKFTEKFTETINEGTYGEFYLFKTKRLQDFNGFQAPCTGADPGFHKGGGAWMELLRKYSG